MDDFQHVMKVAFNNKQARHYPPAADARTRSGVIFPEHRPKFDIKFSSDTTIFTIGSCFARNIEEALLKKSVVMPTRRFVVPKDEWPHRSNGLLNEYNPGTISQRILWALEGRQFSDEAIVSVNDQDYTDLLLPFGADVPLVRALERRRDIGSVYGDLRAADVVIVTLGFVEAWFDNETNLYLNRMPPHAFARKNGGRFVFKRLGVSDVIALLEPAFDGLLACGARIVLTVSPVPIQTTFSDKDCVVANEYSKSVLRVCADHLSNKDGVDYFPSYEIVRSGGLAAYIDDQVHVRNDVVRGIVDYMVSVYSAA